MQVDDIKQTDLTQSERDVLKEDAARWQRMGAGAISTTGSPISRG